MKFPLSHTGRRFFYFTFTLEERQPVLSQLVRGEKHPRLLPPGEHVVEVWKQLHNIEPHFTASDFIVMPDHVHLLLIVNSVGEFRFNPLVFAHWFMDATNDGGLPPPEPPARWDVFYPCNAVHSPIVCGYDTTTPYRFQPKTLLTTHFGVVEKRRHAQRPSLKFFAGGVSG